MEIGRSYACSPTLKPYTYRTYKESVQHWARQDPSKEAFVEYGPDGFRTTLTREQLEKAASSFGRYLLTSGFRQEAVCKIIAKEECTHVYLPAYQIINLLRAPQLSKYFKTVTCIKFAGERFKKRYTDLVKLGFCQRIVVWYGSTEAAGVSAFVSDNLDLYEDGIIGKPLEGVEMKVVHVDQLGRVVPQGDTGDLYIRSVYRFVGYKDQPNLFQEVVDSRGWLNTGDIVHIRQDGNFVLDGRTSEQISCDGVKFFPWDLERILCSIKGVDNAAIVAVPDASFNNVICACLIIDQTSGLTIEEVKQHFEQHYPDTSLKGNTRPKFYVGIEEFPLNSSGKLDRRELANKIGEIMLKSK